MKYYKQNNEVFAYEEDGSQDHLIGNKVAMTVQEVEAHINPPKTAEQIMAEAIAHFEDITTQFIESKVQAYNVANGLAFKNIDAFPKYALNTTSQHYAIANQFIVYSDNVWEAVRAYQSTLTTIPTEEEFKTVLDGVTF